MLSAESRRSDFVLIQDLGLRVQALAGAGLRVPDPDSTSVVDAQRTLCRDVEDALPSATVVTGSLEAIAEEIISAARSRWPDAFLVSACPEIAPEGSAQIEISRLFDLRGRRIGVGPRPGYPSLFEQAAHLADLAEGREVVVLEDGIYSGDTAVALFNALATARLRPVGFVADFVFDAARPRLASIERGGCEFHFIRQLHNPINWHPDHDFFPFIPGSGRVVGFIMEGRHRTNRFPLYDHGGSSYSFPYLAEFSYSSELWSTWTGLPPDTAAIIGENCLSGTAAIFEEIERLNGRTITLEDVIRVPRRVGLPLRLGDYDFPNPERRVLDFLAEVGETTVT